MQYIDLKDKLHGRQSEIVDIFVEIQAWYTEHVQPLEDKQDIGEFAKCLLNYLEQVESFLNFISSCQTGNSEGYRSSLENIIKHFFACDFLNYARLMPVQLAQMDALKTEDPETWSALKSGGFAVAKSEISFTHLFPGKALEQEIIKPKGQGGMVGLSGDEGARDCLVTTVPHLAALVDQCLNSFPKNSRSSARKEYYQLQGKIAVRSQTISQKLQHLIKLH